MEFHVFLGLASEFAAGFQNLGPRSKSVYGVAGNVIKEGYMKDCGMQTSMSIQHRRVSGADTQQQ